MLCPYCNAKNPDDAEICLFCRLRFDDFVDFQGPFDKLTELGNRLVRRDIPADPSQLEREFREVEERIQDSMDMAASVIETNLRDLERLRRETEEQLGDLNLETMTRILDEFDQAQTVITEGLHTVKSTVIDAETSEDISRGMADYSMAMSDINEGMARLDTLRYETSDPKTLTSPPPILDYPEEIFLSQKELDKAAHSLDAFIESEDVRLIHYTLIKLERTRELLLELLEDIAPESLESIEALESLEDEEYDDEELDDEELEEDEDELEDDDFDREIIYRDIDEIVSDEEIAELMASPDDYNYEDILRDRDWQALEELDRRMAESEDSTDDETAPEEPLDEEGAQLPETFSALREDIEE